MADSSPFLQPTPQRRFELAPASTESSEPPTPTPQRSDSSYLDPETSEAKRTRSILNLTSSTLFGIYSPSGDENARGGLSSPGGTGAQTPARLPNGNRPASPILSAVANPKLQKPVAKPIAPQHHSRERNPPLVLRLALLFCSGMAYGLIVRRLHERQQLAPVEIDQIDQNLWRYFILWGGGGVSMGELMPWVDILWEKTFGTNKNPDMACMSPSTPISPTLSSDEGVNPSLGSSSRRGGNWDTIVRGVGAYIGIAFAIVSSHS